MNVKRIKVNEWYQTQKGIGKCLAIFGNSIKLEIDGKEVRLRWYEVQHEIAKGEEPKEDD
jgi:hypothetical protein